MTRKTVAPGPIDRLSFRLLSLVARVRPDERREVAGAFLTLFGFMTGHALLETARDALFLAQLPAARLPWVYLAIAVLALGIGQREPRVVRRLTARSELARWLLVASGVTALFWFIVQGGQTWALYALYVWSGVIASLVVVRFWTVLGSRFTVTQAKRLFPPIASGSVAGAIAGSGAARLLTEVVDPRHLVLAASAAFLLAAAAPTFLAGQEPARRAVPPGGYGEVMRSVWRAPYLRRVAGMVLFATVTFTLIDFVFKSAADLYVAPDDLGAFFSSVYLSINILSLLVQVLGVALILRWMTLATAAAIVPAVLLIGTLGVTVGGGLTLALILKGADGALRHSLYRTGTELLFVPLSERLRTQVKGFIDVMGQRGGQALAAVIILMLLSTTTNPAVFAALAAFTAACWLAVAMSLREPYLDIFRQTLYAEGSSRASGFPALDVASLETLLATLNATDDRRVVAALDVLEEQGKATVVPAPLLFHPSPVVVIRTLGLFTAARRQEAMDTVERLLSHPLPEIRGAALRACVGIAPRRDLLSQATADEDRAVAMTATGGLIACGWGGDRPELEDRVREGVHGGDPAMLRVIAATLAVRQSPRLEPVLLELLSVEDPEVLKEAIRAAGTLGNAAVVPSLIRLLGRRAVRDEARSVLAGLGPVALEGLEEALRSKELSHDIRRHVPGAIAAVGSPRAPEILLTHLRDEPDGLLRFKALRALGRWRREQPSIPLDAGLLQSALGHAVSTGFRLMAWRHVLTNAAARDDRLATELHHVLVGLLRDKQDHALERVFRLLGLQSGSEEFHRVYRGLHSPMPASIAGSRELVQHLVLPPIRKTLMTLVDDLHGESTALPATAAEHGGGHYAEVLGEIASFGMESASSLAAAHAAELDLQSVRDVLTRVRPVSPEHAKALAAAIASLDGEGGT